MSTTTRDAPHQTRRGDRLTADELAAWRGFLRTHAMLTRELDAELLAEHDIALSSYEVLLFLSEAPAGECRMSELADSVLLSRSGLTRLVDRLVRDGLVSRQTDPKDARGTYAVITDEGRERFTEARKTHLDGVRRTFLDHVDGDERAQLAEVWERITGTPDAEAGSPSC